MNDWVSDVDSNLGQPRRRGRGKDCLSHAALDRLALGEAKGAEAETALAHLAACKSCAEMKAFLDHDRSAFLIEANVDALAADALARVSVSGGTHAGRAGGAQAAWWRRLLPALAVFAAAGVAILIPRLRSDSADPNPGVTTKGGFGLTLYVLHSDGALGAIAPAADAQGTLHLGEPLHPGDRIRLQLSGRRDPGADRTMVLALDQTGRVSVYHPAGSLPVGAGAEAAFAQPQLLPTAIELDDTLGAETIVALNCHAAVTTLAAQAAVQAAVVTTAAAGRGLRPGDLGLPCDQARYVIKKVAR